MATHEPRRNSFLSNRPEQPKKLPPSSAPKASTASTTSSTTTQTSTPATPKFVPPPPNSFAFTSIPVLSLSRAQAFYSAVFAWTFRPQTSDSQLIFFTPSSVMGALSLVPSPTTAVEGDPKPEPRAGGVVNYILVDDVDATLQKVVEAGGKIERERWVEGGHTELARFWDPEGNLGGVLKWLV